jgi:uncharacterized tellurite resistance protein B-like protein
MLRTLLAALRAPGPAPLAPDDARLALAALLVRVARSDESYAHVEMAMIDRVLMARYGLDSPSAAALRDQAEKAEAQAPDTVRFTRVIKDAVPYEDRRAVVQALWQVVLADGGRDAHEDAFLRMVVSLIGVSDRDSGLARQRAAGA